MKTSKKDVGSAKELDYLKEYNEWVETTGLVAKGTSYYYEIESIIENALTQQRTELLEEIEKGIQWAIDNSTGDDYHEGLEEAKHITNLLNKKNETK